MWLLITIKMDTIKYEQVMHAHTHTHWYRLVAVVVKRIAKRNETNQSENGEQRTIMNDLHLTHIRADFFKFE